MRDFLGTETGGGAGAGRRDRRRADLGELALAGTPTIVWATQLSIQLGARDLEDLREWVNQGLMTLFFLVVGLEAKREIDLGELRERRRLAFPVLAALGGIAGPVGIYLAFNAGGPGGARLGRGDVDRHGVRARRAGAGAPPATRLRVFLLTLAVVDDLARCS